MAPVKNENAVTEITMKKIYSIILLGLTVSATAMANPAEWLTCTTSGDAISSLHLGVNNAGRPDIMQVLGLLTMPGDQTTSMNAEMKPTDFDAMNRKGEYEIIMRTGPSKDFGGAVSDAGLLTLHADSKTSGKFNGNLSMNGTVYSLSCVSTIE